MLTLHGRLRIIIPARVAEALYIYIFIVFETLNGELKIMKFREREHLTSNLTSIETFKSAHSARFAAQTKLLVVCPL